MRFMSIYRPAETSPSGPTPEHMAEMGKFMEEMTRSGTLLSTGALSGNRASVRFENGKLQVTDGPFVESKELVAGFAVLSHASKSEAIDGVKRFLQIAGDGESEVREVFELEDFAVDASEKPDGWREKERAFRDAEEQRPSPFRKPAAPGKQHYMAFVKADRYTESEQMPSEQMLSEMGALMEEMTKAGTMLGGEGLKPSARGTRVRLSRGEFTITDGPFAESKELVAGFSTIEVDSKEEAVAFAARMAEIHSRGLGGAPAEIEVFQMF